MKRILTFILIYALIVSQAFAIPFIDRHESYKYGNGTTSTKSFEYDFGLGVLNPKMQVDNAQGFVFDKALSSQGLTSPSLSVTGTGTATFSGKGLFLDDLTGKNLKASGNALTIGDGAATNKSITFDKGAGASNPFMKWDETQAALVYSNDGTLVKKIGSGSGGGDGGGVNFLKNGGFEDLKANWTESGGTFTAEAFATGIESDLKFGQWVATSASQTLCSDLVTTPSFANAGGMFDLAYTASGSQFLVYVKDGSGNKLTSDQSLLDQTAWAKLSPIPFSFNTSQRLCFESKGAATLKLNNVYMGTNKGVGNLIGFSKREGQFNFASPTGLSIGVLPITGTDVNNGFEVSGNSIKILESGYYTLMAGMWGGGAGGSGWVSIMPRKNSSSMGILWRSANNSLYTNLSGFTTYYLDKNDLIDLYLNEVVGTVSGSIVYLNIQLAKPNTDTFQTPESSQWFIDANIGGSIPALGSAAQTSFTTISDSGLDLVLNYGSSNAFISCNGYDSNALTCPSSSEQLGISFVPPRSGLYEVCTDFGFYSNGTTEVNTTFQLVETGLADNVVIQEGKSRIYTQSNSTNSVPFKLCGTFLFSSSTKRNIKLAFEKNVSTQSPTVLADRSATNGQRDTHWTVRPLLQDSLRAILTGNQVTAPKQTKFATCGYALGGSGSLASPSACTSTPCTLYSDSCSSVSGSITRNSTGDYGFLTTGWVANTPINCTGQAVGVSGAWPVMSLMSDSNGQITVRGRSGTPGGTLVDAAISMQCFGSRN